MSFIEHLMRLGLLYDADGKGGGNSTPTGRSLEELTNQKISGTLEDPDAKPKPDPEPDEDEPDPEPKPKAKKPKVEPEEDDEDEPDPDEDEDEDEDPDPDETEDDLDEDEDQFYYDPEKHVEGKPAHTNKFKTREQAEYAAIQKAALAKESLEDMEKEGIGRGAIPLPAALKGDIAALDNMTNLEIVASMDDAELRSFLNESDKFRQRLEQKFESRKAEIESSKTRDKFEKLQDEVYGNLKNIMDNDEIKANLEKFSDVSKGKPFVQKKIDEKVKAELKEDRDKLAAWIDKVDSGDIEMSFKEFDEEKTRRLSEMQRKEKDIREKYEPVLGQLEDLYDLSKNVEQNKELTPEQRSKNMWNAFNEAQSDLSGEYKIFNDTPEARAELVSAKQWAIQNAADFNDLQKAADWGKALTKGWEDFKERVRAGRQKKELEDEPGGKKPGKAPSDQDDDIPKPGDQEDIKGDRKKSVADVRRRSLDRLEQLTNATVGA